MIHLPPKRQFTQNIILRKVKKEKPKKSKSESKSKSKYKYKFRKNMRAVKISAKDSKKIVLGTKTIYKYILPTKLFDIARMVVKGRHPVDPKKVILEKDCDFAMYVTKGEGKYFVNGEEIKVVEGDVVFVPAGSTFACEGNFEYITVDVPAYYPEQSEEVEK